MLPKKPCKWCKVENPNHWPFQCNQNKLRRKYRLPKEGRIAFAMKDTRNVWFRENPPNDEGYYICYICQKWLTPAETTLDHVKSRSSHPELRYDLTNLEPCCFPCNGKKGSQSLERFLNNA